MQKKIYERLSDLEKELYRDVWADVTYKDGTQKRIKMLDVLSLYTNGGTPPQIADVSFIGNTSNQGILPDLVKYLIETIRYTQKKADEDFTP